MRSLFDSLQIAGSNDEPSKPSDSENEDEDDVEEAEEENAIEDRSAAIAELKEAISAQQRAISDLEERIEAAVQEEDYDLAGISSLRAHTSHSRTNWCGCFKL